MVAARNAAPLLLEGSVVGAAQLHADDAPFTADGVHGVGAQIQQGLLNLGGIGHYGRNMFVDTHLQVDRWRQRDLEQACGLVHHLGQMDGDPGGCLIAAEGQDLAHQIARPPPGLFDLQQAGHGRRLVARVLLGQFHVAQNGTEDVVEVVRDAAGHRAYGLHFL